MKHSAIIMATLSLLIIPAFFIACNNDKKIKEETKNDVTGAPTNDTFIYGYVDASVPPQYHRSYTIRVTPAQAHYVIDVYGDVIVKDSSALTPAAYTGFVTALNDLHIKKKKEVQSGGCTGGTTDKLNLYGGSNKEVKGHIYYCANKEFGDLEGNVAAAADLFKALIPGLPQKIDSTRKNN